MNRSSIRWAVLLLGGGVWFATPSTASAQPAVFYPGFGFYTPGGMVAYGGFYRQPVVVAPFVNPYWAGFYTYPSAYVAGTWSPAYQYPYATPGASYGMRNYWSSGYGSASSSAIVNEQLRLFRAAGARAEPYDSTTFPKKMPQPGVFGPKDFSRIPPGQKLANVDDRLVNAEEAQILSGKALNDLVTAIRGLERKGAKAESPLFPAELAVRATYAGAPAADLVALVRERKVEPPAPFAHQRLIDVRNELQKQTQIVLDVMAAGKPPGLAPDRLAATVRTARDRLKVVRDLSPEEMKTVTQYLDRLDELARLARNPSLAELAVPQGDRIGLTAAEMLRHMDQLKVNFGPAPQGADDAYLALYRGLVGYYVGLAQAKK